MAAIQVFDRPMCCSTGVCGPSVDPVLPRFAADLEWLKTTGHQVDRFNLAQQPAAFIENRQIHGLISSVGTDCLPVILVDGKIVSQGCYPNRDAMAAWVDPSIRVMSLNVIDGGNCCG